MAAGYAAIRVCPQRPVSAGPHRLGTVALLTAAILLAAAGGGYALQRRFNADSLRGRDPVIDWVLTHAPSHTRIGLTGSWSTDAPPVLAMFGPRFGNTVRYVGRVDGGLVRHFSSYRAWIRAVQADRLGLLLVGRQPQPLESDIEARWAARARFPVLAISPRFALYRPVAPS